MEIKIDGLNETSKALHEHYVKQGFYDYEVGIPEKLMLIVSELSEALEADRKGRHADIRQYKRVTKQSPQCFKEWIKDTFEDEIADTFIRLMDLCGWLDIDIESHIKTKQEYNETREYKHGKQY